MSRIAIFLGLALFALPTLAASQGRVPLAEEAHINEELVAAKAGDILRNTCPEVSARWLVIWDKTWALRQYAVQQGYTEPEVKAFLKDPAQKARIQAEAEAYLARAGARPGDVESYCQVGRDEVARGTLLGQIIRAGD